MYLQATKVIGRIYIVSLLYNAMLHVYLTHLTTTSVIWQQRKYDHRNIFKPNRKKTTYLHVPVWEGCCFRVNIFVSNMTYHKWDLISLNKYRQMFPFLDMLIWYTSCECYYYFQSNSILSDILFSNWNTHGDSFLFFISSYEICILI